MRSAKSVELSTKNFTKDEYRNRKNTQDKLKGNADKIEPSNRLNANQKKLFRYIVSELENSKVLGNLDTFMLEMGVIAIDRLQVIEKSINQDFDMIYNK
jgi:phage terminase small subunit